MKKPKITPGPWRYENGRICYGETVQTERGTAMKVIAQPHGGVLRTYKGNCQAIAALPDLLSALEQMVDCNLSAENCASFEVANKRIRNLARQALTKAGYTFD